MKPRSQRLRNIGKIIIEVVAWQFDNFKIRTYSPPWLRAIVNREKDNSHGKGSWNIIRHCTCILHFSLGSPALLGSRSLVSFFFSARLNRDNRCNALLSTGCEISHSRAYCCPSPGP